MAMAFDALRVGHIYRITNYGETREFVVMKRLSNQNYMVKDRISLEQYELADLVRWGIGKDYDLDEISQQGTIR